MAKICLLLICIVGVYFGLTASTNIECEYNNGGWHVVKNSYYCSVKNNLGITTRESATITSVTGYHQSGKTNSDVNGFLVQSTTFYYFPRGLETFFKNLKVIHIYNSKIKEVYQEDLKPFSNLVEIYLYYNSIEVLEEGLFDFNNDLEWIYFDNNKIVHIDPNVFDHLSKLKYLNLFSNTCINKNAYNSISAVKNVIQAAKSQCINSDFSSLKTQIKNLEKDSKILNSDELMTKIASFEETLKSSRFANYFQNKLQNLKDVQVKKAQDETTTTTTTTTQKPTTTTQAPTTTTTENINLVTCLAIESKVDNIATSLKDLMTQTSNGTSSKNINNGIQCDAIEQELRNQSAKIDNKIETFTEVIDTKLEILDESVVNFRTASLREIQNFRTEVKTNLIGVLNAVKLRTDKIEKQNKEIKDQNSKLEEKLEKIMKALNIAD